MKIAPGFRISIIILFILIYSTGMVIFHNFYIGRLQNIDQAVKNMDFDTSLGNIGNNSKFEPVILRYRESLAAIHAIERETKIYSAIYLFFLLFTSIFIFGLAFHFIAKPLNELQSAAFKIRDGEYDIQLRETGFKEIKNLKKSFNSMSRELVKTQNKLVKAEKEMIWKEFSRILAHEIKNPLTPIQLTLERLEEKYYSDEESFIKIFPESMKIIVQEVENLKSLAKSFSGYAKTVEPTFITFLPAKQIFKIISPYLSDRVITVIKKDDFTIEFDQFHFYQIITNLLQNALDACSKNDEIKILLEKKTGQKRIIIEDRGKGIADEDLRRIFEPYFSKKKKGIGLGLALVKKLVEVNRAKIEVESNIGIGTKFTIIKEDADENSNN